MRVWKLLNVRVVVVVTAVTVALGTTTFGVAAENFNVGDYSGGTTGYTMNAPDNTYINFYAFASSSTVYGDAAIYATLNGYNNGNPGQSWHFTQGGQCYEPANTAQRSCSTNVANYDQIPGSTSTQRYATTQHYFARSSGSFFAYTSTDPPGRSTPNCYSTPGC